MNKETIQSKALEFASLRYGNSGNETGNEIAKVQACAVGFRQGAKWRIKSIWHDAKERPASDKYLLVPLKEANKFCIIWTNIEPTNWDDYVKDNKITIWAYIGDLLPDRKEGNHD